MRNRVTCCNVVSYLALRFRCRCRCLVGGDGDDDGIMCVGEVENKGEGKDQCGMEGRVRNLGVGRKGER